MRRTILFAAVLVLALAPSALAGESDSALACAAGRVLDAVRRRGRDWPVWV